MRPVSVIIAMLLLATAPLAAQTWLRDCPNTGQKSQLDTCCGNYGDDLPIDTLQGPYPDIRYWLCRGSLSPDGKYLAAKAILDMFFQPKMNGFVIVDLAEQRIVDYHPGATLPRYSPDGRYILTTGYVFEPATGSRYQFPSIWPDYLLQGDWSPDSRYVYMGSTAGIYRWKVTGDSLHLYHTHSSAVPLTDDTLIWVDAHPENLMNPGYELTYIPKDSSTYMSVPAWSILKSVGELSVAPDRHTIAFDVTYSGGGRFNDKHGLCIFDRWTGRMKQVLPAQAFMNRYYPRWTSRGTLVVSFACRKDSSYTLWEVDTNGTFLRPLADRSLFDPFIVSANPAPAPSSVRITAVYPQPASNVIVVEYFAGEHARYRFTISDVLGRQLRLIETRPANGPGAGSVTIDTSELPPGPYLLRITDSRRIVAFRRIAVSR